MMAPANRREVFDQFVMTAKAVTELGEHMRRVTFYAPELASFALTGPDEYFGLLGGDAGPGTRWARRAVAGDQAGFRAGGSAYRPPSAGSVLLAADETALPALSAILEAETRPVQVPGESYRTDLDAE